MSNVLTFKMVEEQIAEVNKHRGDYLKPIFLAGIRIMPSNFIPVPTMIVCQADYDALIESLKKDGTIE